MKIPVIIAIVFIIIMGVILAGTRYQRLIYEARRDMLQARLFQPKDHVEVKFLNISGTVIRVTNKGHLVIGDVIYTVRLNPEKGSSYPVPYTSEFFHYELQRIELDHPFLTHFPNTIDK